MTPSRARDYLHVVTSHAWQNRHNDEPLVLTFAQALDRKRWRVWQERGAWALVIGIGVYGAACVVHTTITLIQWALS